MKKITFLFGFLLTISQVLNAQTYSESLKTLDSLETKAKRGDVAAMWEVGNCYARIGKNDSAEYWLLKAYQKDKNNAKGNYLLGLFYRSKLNGNDEKKGKKYLKKSAELGNINAVLTLFEDSKPKNMPSLFEPYKEWKKFQDDEGECKRYASLALSLTPGDDFHSYINLADAADWIGNVSMQKLYAVKALNNGEYGAIRYMVNHNIMPNDDTKPEYLYEFACYIRDKTNFQSDEWISLFRKSAQKGYAPAQLRIGSLYLRGYGQDVKKDTLKAIAWYKESAKNGNANASIILASFYQQGIYCQKNSELAFNMFKQIADTVNIDKAKLTYITASYLIGLCYYYGIGVQKDYSKAMDYLLNAADNRKEKTYYADIAYIVGCIYYETGDVKTLNYLSAYSNSPITDVNYLRYDAMKKISSCYRSGRCGVQQDISLAKKYEAMVLGYGEVSNQNIQDTVWGRAISTLLIYF